VSSGDVKHDTEPSLLTIIKRGEQRGGGICEFFKLVCIKSEALCRASQSVRNISWLSWLRTPLRKALPARNPKSREFAHRAFYFRPVLFLGGRQCQSGPECCNP